MVTASAALRRGQRIGRLAFQDPEEVGEIHPAQRQPDGRHDDVVDQRGDDAGEGRADDHADRQIQRVAAHGELF